MKDQSGRRKRKRTGGRKRPIRKKRKDQLGRQPTETQVGERTLRVIDSRGSEKKIRALRADTASVAEGGEVASATIEGVEDNPANPNYARRNIITKGAIIRTSEGTARVTSRPGQDGQVNAVAVDEE